MTRAALRELAWIVGALAVSVTVVLATSKDAVRAARGASSHTATVIVDFLDSVKMMPFSGETSR